MRLPIEVEAIIFRRNDKRIEYLLLKRLPQKNGFWQPVTGGVEEGESEIEALKRELAEEVNLKNVRILDKIYEYSYVWKDLFIPVSTYAVEANVNEKIKLQADERESPITDFAWVTKEKAVKMLYWKDEKKAVKSFKS